MNRETIVTGQYYRILTDIKNKKWDRLSFWTHAKDVERTNGTNVDDTLTDLEDKLNGYTLVVLTQAEYDALPTKDDNTLYFIKED